MIPKRIRSWIVTVRETRVLEYVVEATTAEKAKGFAGPDDPIVSQRITREVLAVEPNE